MIFFKKKLYAIYALVRPFPLLYATTGVKRDQLLYSYKVTWVVNNTSKILEVSEPST